MQVRAPHEPFSAIGVGADDRRRRNRNYRQCRQGEREGAEGPNPQQVLHRRNAHTDDFAPGGAPAALLFGNQFEDGDDPIRGLLALAEPRRALDDDPVHGIVLVARQFAHGRSNCPPTLPPLRRNSSMRSLNSRSDRIASSATIAILAWESGGDRPHG
ncbi:hypothetical protein A5692_13385 [Mycobacterium sp. E342]|uniref:hypothetical protein n=1 Tax=Mycobacterium sp. E342 TaxID=1834147 RepID=UPI0008009989|nr:hypothetical protein A5692_13385 [Mycobacterium sp. E342]